MAPNGNKAKKRISSSRVCVKRANCSGDYCVHRASRVKTYCARIVANVLINHCCNDGLRIIALTAMHTMHRLLLSGASCS